MKKIIRRRIILKNGMVADLEEHPKTEMPVYYPEKTDLLEDGTLALSNCHSQYWHPTEEAQAELAKKIQSAKSWGYLYPVQGRERIA